MKILFAHDCRFLQGTDGKHYSEGQFPYRLWERYREFFDEIVVAGRMRALRAGEKISDFDLSSGPGVTFVEISSISSPRGMLFGRREAVRQLRSAMVDCDAVVARISEIGRLACLVALEQGKPWVAEVVTDSFSALWNHGSWQGKVFAPFAHFETRRVVRQAPFALYVTREYLQRLYPCTGSTAGCSDVLLTGGGPQVLERRLERIGQRRETAVIGLIGSLATENKGLGTALQALGRLATEGQEFEFRVLGGGDKAPWLHLAKRWGVDRQTRFYEPLPGGDAVNGWLDEVDVYIQPSFIEGLPRALIEAMNRACPALGSTAGGIPELLPPDCLHRPKTEESLTSMLRRALVDREWQTKQAERNYLVAQEYRPEVLDGIRRDFWSRFVKFVNKVRH